MKLLRARLQEAAKDSGLQLGAIERDYAQSYILAGIVARPALGDTLIFKGGTALKKAHFKSYRFSEDLDFSAVDAPRATRSRKSCAKPSSRPGKGSRLMATSRCRSSATRSGTRTPAVRKPSRCA